MIYVYCVTDRAPDLKRSSGKGEKGLYAIGHGGLFAVVNGVSAEEFGETRIDERLTDAEWLQSKILDHEATVESIMVDGAVLPFKFATVFESEENVKKMLDENNITFSFIIEGFRGKEEWGVKIYVDSERLQESLIYGREEIGALDRDIAGTTPGRAYMLKKKRANLITVLAGRVIDEYGDHCLASLSEGSVLARINGIIGQDITARKEEMILNAAFLVQRDGVGAFKGRLDELRAKYGDAGFSFDLTGPWPPYNFCSWRTDDGA